MEFSKPLWRPGGIAGILAPLGSRHVGFVGAQTRAKGDDPDLNQMPQKAVRFLETVGHRHEELFGCIGLAPLASGVHPPPSH